MCSAVGVDRASKESVKGEPVAVTLIGMLPMEDQHLPPICFAILEQTKLAKECQLREVELYRERSRREESERVAAEACQACCRMAARLQVLVSERATPPGEDCAVAYKIAAAIGVCESALEKLEASKSTYAAKQQRRESVEGYRRSWAKGPAHVLSKLMICAS
jgi:hypothetical protein